MGSHSFTFTPHPHPLSCKGSGCTILKAGAVHTLLHYVGKHWEKVSVRAPCRSSYCFITSFTQDCDFSTELSLQ